MTPSTVVFQWRIDGEGYRGSVHTDLVRAVYVSLWAIRALNASTCLHNSS